MRRGKLLQTLRANEGNIFLKITRKLNQDSKELIVDEVSSSKLIFIFEFFSHFGFKLEFETFQSS